MRRALLPMARRLVAPTSVPAAAANAAAGALVSLRAGGGRARFSSKRRERYGSESEARQTTRLLSFAKKKQQAQLGKLKLALAQEEIARATLDTGTSVASAPASASAGAGAATTVDAPATDMTRARRAKLAKQERIKHLPLFRPGSPLLSHFGERTLGHYEHLPLARFEGDVAVIHSASEEQPHAEYLRAQRVIGVDTESKPDFRKHKRGNPVCLIQLATLDRAFIYRLQRGQPLPPVLRELFEDARVLKVGHSLNDDFRLLKASELVRAVNSTIDTLPIANKLGCLRPGLRTLGQLFLGGSISKDMQVSNWEASVLSDAQISYAATDAWAPLRVLLAMVELDDTRPLLRIKSYNSAAHATVDEDHDKVLAILYALVRGRDGRSETDKAPM